MSGRRTKKARQEDGGAAAAAPDARPAALQAFEGWMRSQGITWDTDRVALRAGAPGCAHQGWAVYAQAGGIAEGDHLCNIPKDAVLSVRTTAFADMINQERLGGGLGECSGQLSWEMHSCDDHQCLPSCSCTSHQQHLHAASRADCRLHGGAHAGVQIQMVRRATNPGPFVSRHSAQQGMTVTALVPCHAALAWC